MALVRIMAGDLKGKRITMPGVGKERIRKKQEKKTRKEKTMSISLKRRSIMEWYRSKKQKTTIKKKRINSTRRRNTKIKREMINLTRKRNTTNKKEKINSIRKRNTMIKRERINPTKK